MASHVCSECDKWVPAAYRASHAKFHLRRGGSGLSYPALRMFRALAEGPKARQQQIIYAQPVSAEETVGVDTEIRPLTVPVAIVRIWQKIRNFFGFGS
jgi:hypothetical protein